MGVNDEVWEFKADPTGFVAGTAIMNAALRDLQAELRKAAEQAWKFRETDVAAGQRAVENAKEHAKSIEEITIALKRRTEAIKTATAAEIDYSHASQQSTAAKGPYVPGSADYMSGENPSLMAFLEANAARQKEIADDVTAYHKQKYVEDLSAYSAKWRQKLDLDREEAAAKVANAERDAIETKRREDEKSQIFEQKFRERMAKHKLEQDEIHQINDKLIADDARMAAMQVAADTGPVASEKAQRLAALKIQLAQLTQEYEELHRASVAAHQAAAGGSKVAEVAAEKLEQQLLGVRIKLHEVNRELEAKDGFRGARMMFTEGARGAQDFLTVLAMPGMGLNDAFRAASNNIEVMAMSIKGLNMGFVVGLTMLPSLIQSGTALYKWLNKESKEAAESHAKHVSELLKSIGTIKDYNEHIERMSSLTDKSKNSIEGLIEAEGALADIKLAEMLKPLNEAASGREGKIKTLENQIASMEKNSVKFLNKEDRERFQRDPNAFFGSFRAELEKEKSELLAINEKRDRIKRERETDIAKQTIDRQFRSVDAPMRVTADRAAGTFGPINDEMVINQLVKESGIKPANEAEARQLRGKLESLLRESKEKAMAEEKRARGMSPEEREKERAEIRRKAAEEEARSLREPLGAEEREIRKAEREYSKASRFARDPKSRGGVRETIEEKNELRLMKDALEALRNTYQDHKDAVDEQIELMKEANRLAKDPNVAAIPAVPPRVVVFGRPMRNPDFGAFV